MSPSVIHEVSSRRIGALWVGIVGVTTVLPLGGTVVGPSIVELVLLRCSVLVVPPAPAVGLAMRPMGRVPSSESSALAGWRLHGGDEGPAHGDRPDHVVDLRFK